MRYSSDKVVYLFFSLSQSRDQLISMLFFCFITFIIFFFFIIITVFIGPPWLICFFEVITSWYLFYFVNRLFLPDLIMLCIANRLNENECVCLLLFLELLITIFLIFRSIRGVICYTLIFVRHFSWIGL